LSRLPDSFFFAVHNLAHGIHRLADAAANVTFSLFRLAFRLQVPVA